MTAIAPFADVRAIRYPIGRVPKRRDRLIRLIIAIAIAMCAGLLGAPLAAQETVSDKAGLDRIVGEYVEQGIFPMLYVRVEDREGNVVYEHGVNNSELVPGATISGDTWLRIWSMSKIVTITAALDMIEDELLAFDDPIAKFIPELADLPVAVGPDGRSISAITSTSDGLNGANTDSATLECPYDTIPANGPITLRHLLNHTAGFYYGVTQAQCLNDQAGAQKLAQARDSEDLIERLAKLPLIQQPGERYFYGTNTTVLGLVMERATGQTLAEIVAERVTDPLGITDLRYGLPNEAELAPRFIGDEGKLRVADPKELDIFASSPPEYAEDSQLFLGGEGMVATSAAYADFLQMLLGRGAVKETRILNEMTIEAITSPHTQLRSDWGHNGWNLWVNSGLLGNGKMGVGNLWIGGGYEGTAFWVDQERGLIGLINTQVHRAPEGAGAAVETIREAFYERFNGE